MNLMASPSSIPKIRSHKAVSAVLPFLPVILLALVAATPLFQHHLTAGDDTYFHLFRFVHLDALFQNNIWYSRWLPKLVYGYGYPLFNYYAPASYYLAYLPRLFGLTLPLTLLIGYITTFVIQALGTFLWARRLLGAQIALLVVAAVVFSPYTLINAVHRGAFAECMALALMPFTFWLLERCIHIGSRRDIAGFVGVTSVLILTHNITALITIPTLVCYTLIFGRKAAGKSLSHLLGYLALAIGCATWFWLPALRETDFVQIGLLTEPVSFHYTRHFLTLSEIFSTPFFYDAYIINQERFYSLHLPVAILAFIGLLGVAKLRTSLQRTVVLASGLIIMVTIFLMLPYAIWFWEQLPLIKFLQFPWRFLGLTTQYLALLAGFGTRVIWRKLSFSPIPILISLIAIWSIPWGLSNNQDRISVWEEVTIVDSAMFTAKKSGYGTTSMGEFTPIGVAEFPPFQGVATAFNPERLTVRSLPAGSQIVSAAYTDLTYDIVVDLPEQTNLVFDTFYFPGWQVWVDEQRVPIRPTAPHGLISFPVPAGEHEVVVNFGTTPLRRIAVAVSIGSLITTAFVVYRTR